MRYLSKKSESDILVSLSQDGDDVHVHVGDLTVITIRADGTLELWAGCEGNDAGIKVNKAGYPTITRG